MDNRPLTSADLSFNHPSIVGHLLRHRCLGLFLGVLLCFTSSTAQAQGSASVSGIVSDSTSGEPLIAANLFVASLFRGTSTNADGYYALTDIPEGSVRLRFTYVGYETVFIDLVLAADEQRRLDIELKPVTEEFEEVVVTAAQIFEEEARDIGVAALDIETIKLLPAVLEPDVFRSLQLLPGVSAASDYSSGLYVRGGDPGQTNILLDRTKIYNPTHFFGVFSTFNPDAIKDVKLYKGGFPAEYGGSIGSVLDIVNKDGNRNEWHGGVTLGLLASRLFVEGPHPVGSYMLAVRRSTLEPLLAALDGTSGIPDSFFFYDVNGKINFDISRSDILSASFYRGTDKLSLGLFGDGAYLNLRYGNATGTLTWTHIYSGGLLTNLTLTTSEYFSTPTATFGGTEIRLENRIYDTSIRGDVEYFLNASNELDFGFWAGQFIAPLRNTFDTNEAFSWRRRIQYASAYFQNTYKPSRTWQLQGGVRATYLSDGNHIRLEPRLTVEHQPQDRLRLQAAVGRYYQFLTLVSNESFSGFDYWLTSAEGVQPAFGDQFILGAKFSLPYGINVDTEVFYRTMRELFEPDPFLNNPAGIDYPELFVFGKGWARGIEVLAQRNQGRVFGFLAYTLGQTRRKFPTFNLNREGVAESYPPKFDRLHDIRAVGSLDLGRQWVFTTVFTYATGQAITKPSTRYQVYRSENQLANGSGETIVLLSPGLNSSRLPAYHRLDVGVRKRGRFFDFADYELLIQAVNAYARRNIWFNRL